MLCIQNGILKKYIGNAEKLIVPDGVSRIEEFAFGTLDYEQLICPNLEEVVLPESMTEIGNYAFYRCESLKKINLPENLKCIGKESFCKCRKLEEVIIPDGVTEIPSGAFNCCYSVREMQIPETVTKIGENALCACILEKLAIPEHIILSPEVFDYFSQVKHAVYRGIRFSGAGYKSIRMRDCITLINEHDISVRIPSPEKEFMIFQLYCRYPEDKECIRFLKDKFTSKFRVLIDRRETELVRKILEYGLLITKGNINSCIFYSVQQGAAEITLLLTDYKYQHFGYEDIQTVVSRKFSL